MRPLSNRVIITFRATNPRGVSEYLGMPFQAGTESSPRPKTAIPGLPTPSACRNAGAECPRNFWPCCPLGVLGSGLSLGLWLWLGLSLYVMVPVWVELWFGVGLGLPLSGVGGHPRKRWPRFGHRGGPDGEKTSDTGRPKEPKNDPA